MRVADLLINWRFINKLTQRDAALQIGISASSLCRVEKGSTPDGETVVKLVAWMFGTEPKNDEAPVPTNSGDQRSDVPSPAPEG